MSIYIDKTVIIQKTYTESRDSLRKRVLYMPVVHGIRSEACFRYYLVIFEYHDEMRIQSRILIDLFEKCLYI